MGSKRMNPTASATTPTAGAASATTATTATLSGECRDIRHHAERANRNARCQNSYCFLLHGGSPIEVPKALWCSQCSRADLTDLTALNFGNYGAAPSPPSGKKKERNS
jgi:hypothetical protein